MNAVLTSSVLPGDSAPVAARARQQAGALAIRFALGLFAADMAMTFSSLQLATVPLTWARAFGGLLGCIVAAVPPAVAIAIAASWVPRDGWARTLALAAALVIGTALALPGLHWFATVWGTFVPVSVEPFDLAMLYLANWLQYCALGAVVLAALVWWQRDARVAESLHQARLARARMATQCDAATSSLLRAQIEPHFLFNTLATIKQLGVCSEPGDRMLARLIDYMRAARVHLRRREATLGEELALAHAYLEIQAIRMGTRLRFEAQVPDELMDNRIPPATLLTLVENAVKHGLAPLPQGGHIGIRAARVGAGQIEVGVSDDGAGFRASFGKGLGLANVRDRLQALYGARAALSLATRTPRGICASLTLPEGPPELPR